MSDLRFPSAIPGLVPLHQGKTRDTFATKSSTHLLVVATDRLSTHNVIHKSTIPHKGEVLTALTVFWIRELLSKFNIRHHLVEYGQGIYDFLSGSEGDYPPGLHRRAIIVDKLSMIPVEFVWRNYLTGSLYKNFYAKGLPNPYGDPLPEGLSVMSAFEEPMFTPTDKSETDDPLHANTVGGRYFNATSLSWNIFLKIGDYLRKRGIELVDSKFELGRDGSGRAVVADEIVTPDSSRFCELSEIQVGKEPRWLDKQVARDEAERIWGDGPKVPLEFSSEIIDKVSKTYLEIFERITDQALEDFRW